MEISTAKREINAFVNSPKYEAMLGVAAILTELLSIKNIKPIIVGGLSVEIYTNQAYATRDIDFVSDGYAFISDLLIELDFKKEGRIFYHEKIEIAIEIPDNHLAGSYEKVKTLELENGRYIYVIGVEDIILDRLRAMVNWNSEEDGEWALDLLTSNIDTLDIDYLLANTETKEEKEELQNWIRLLK